MRRSTGIASVVVAMAIVACVSDPNLTTVDHQAEAGTAGGDDAGDATVDVAPEATTPGEESGTVVEDPAIAACAAACPAAGGTCSGATCTIACPGAAGCTSAITCPAGVACKVTCVGLEGCAFVDCGGATTCRVECTGDKACKRVRSTAGQTDVGCTGKDACTDVGCSGASCAVQCTADACKAADVRCCATQCTVNGAAGRCN